MSANNNLYTVLVNGFPANCSATAIDTGKRKYSWADIDTGSGRLAGLLDSLGLAPGSRLAVIVDKSPEALLLYLAAVRAGLVYLPLNPAYQPDEVAYFLADATPAVVVCSTAAAQWCEPLAHKHGVRHVFTLDADGSGTLMQAAAGHAEDFATLDRQADDLLAILYTSGTTGRSKGAMLTHGNLISNALTLHRYWAWSDQDVLLHMLPVYHVHGLFVAAQGALLAGAAMMWLPAFDVDRALQLLPRCTMMMGVPTYYVRLLADDRLNKSLCSNMRLFISGSAPLLPGTMQAFEARTGHTILERYGMSETCMNTSNPYDPAQGRRLAGTVGPALPGIRVRVVDDSDRPVPTGQPGHVQIKGPNVFAGYWQMPEKTREEFTADGWFRTGDVGVLGGSGIPDDYLSIVGRNKDMIITGGLNVYPREIELLLDAMPGVLESAVVGLPHADFGEAVTAFLVPASGSRPDSQAMLQQLKAQLANYKVPKAIHIIEELPRNAMGKVQKNRLRDLLAQNGATR